MKRCMIVLACAMLNLFGYAQSNKNEQLWEQQRKVACVINAIDQL